MSPATFNEFVLNNPRYENSHDSNSKPTLFKNPANDI